MEAKIRILVIGGRGFLGKEISIALKEAGFSVVIATRSDLHLDNHVKLDIFSKDEVLKVLRSNTPELVINCAWITEHTTYLNSIENEYFQSAAVNLFEECQKIGVRHFIGLGSSAEYYNQSESDFSNLEDQFRFTKYGNSKRQTLRDVLKVHQDDLMVFNWLRIFQPYGPGQDSKRFLPSVIRSLQSNLPVTIQSPYAVRDWVTTRDIASAVLHLVKIKTSGTVDIGSTEGISNLELCKKLGAVINPQYLQFNISDNNDKSVRVASRESILFQTGWTPKDDLSTGFNWVLKGY